MSSTVFSIELKPRESLRVLLMCCGVAAAAAGMVLIVTLPLNGWSRALLAVLWGWQALRELRMQRHGMAQVAGIRLDSGGAVRGLDGDGEWRSLELRSGSIVLSSFAWLRLRLPDGSHYGELLAGDTQSSRNWHGLQLIWRQSRGAFGGRPGS